MSDRLGETFHGGSGCEVMVFRFWTGQYGGLDRILGHEGKSVYIYSIHIHQDPQVNIKHL